MSDWYPLGLAIKSKTLLTADQKMAMAVVMTKDPTLKAAMLSICR